MSLPNSLRAYSDCKDLYDAALADPKGCRACLGTYESCMSMRTRMHYYRNLDRKANAETYERGHPMHGVSVYDDFVIRILKDEDSAFWLYIQPNSAKILYIEGLSDVPDLIDVEPTETKMLEDQSK